MTLMPNDPQLKKLRKYESILTISGLGVIAFSVWSIIRAGIFYFLNPFDVTNYITQEDLDQAVTDVNTSGLGITEHGFNTVVFIIFFGVLCVELLLRVYVGLSARAYGRGRRRMGLYIFFVWFMAAAMLITISVTVDDYLEPIITAIRTGSADALEGTSYRGDQAASVSLLVDVTAFLVLVEVGVSSMKVRSLRKKLGITPVKHWRKQKKELQELTDEVSQELTKSLSSILGE